VIAFHLSNDDVWGNLIWSTVATVGDLVRMQMAVAPAHHPLRRSKVEPMKEVAAMIRKHFEGVLGWVETRQTNGFLEAINGLFQAAKGKARGYGRFRTIRTVIFLVAGKLDFSKLNPYIACAA